MSFFVVPQEYIVISVFYLHLFLSLVQILRFSWNINSKPNFNFQKKVFWWRKLMARSFHIPYRSVSAFLYHKYTETFLYQTLEFIVGFHPSELKIELLWLTGFRHEHCNLVFLIYRSLASILFVFFWKNPNNCQINLLFSRFYWHFAFPLFTV